MTITEDDIFEYLEHHGVKGMRWGVRNINARLRERSRRATQAQINVLRNVAAKKSTRGDRINVGLTSSLTDLLRDRNIADTAERRLNRARKLQKEIKSGKKKSHDMLLRFGGVRISDINYSPTKTQLKTHFKEIKKRPL